MLLLSTIHLSWVQDFVALALLVLACAVAIVFVALFAQKVSRWSLWKMAPSTLAVLALLSCVTTDLAQKAGGDGGTENRELRIENGELGGGPRSLPPELVSMSNLIAILNFAADPPNKEVAFEVACSNILFDYTASRNLYLFASTNLLEPRWMPICAFAMPADTNICAFAVTTNDVDAAVLPWFLDSMNGLGFYRFAADIDSDYDGLIDSYETLWTLTDPDNPDTDGDGLSDGYEIAIGTDPLETDTDGDGMNDWHECLSGTDPTLADTDGDGLSDGDEVLTHGTNPLLPDTDGDGLSDAAEVSTTHTNPLVADTDGDTLSDGEEVSTGTNPLLPDTDSDGMPDGWEVLNALDPTEDDAAGDADGDGLANLDEWRAGTNPNAPDTDGDGLPDAVECARATISADAVPWFDMTGAAVISSAAADVGAALYSCDLPFTNRLSAVLVEKAVADVNGIVYLGDRSSVTNLFSRDECRNLSESLEFPGIVVAPYWSDLRLRTSIGSAISHKLASHSGTNYFVIQYSRVGTQGWSANNEFSFQISVPETGPSNTVYVRYGTLVDGRGDACMVSIGAQASGGAARAPLSFATPIRTPVESGTTVAYRFGCGTDPLNADTDGDGLADGDEALAHGTDSLVADTDGDGLCDGWEVRCGLDPLSATGDDGAPGDPDGDGLSNTSECAAGTNPSVLDTDGDGLSDGAEALTHGSNPLVADTDGDGIDDGEEVSLGTSPTSSDTDGDGLSDGWEVLCGLDPLSASGDDGAAGDPDGDGVENVRELALETDPLDDDTDLDGLSDGEEAGSRSFDASAYWLDWRLFSEFARLGWRVFTADDPPDGIRMALPNPIVAPNCIYTSFSVDTRGVFHLYTNSTDMVYAPLLPCRDLEREAVLDSALTVAPLWAPLEFGTQSVVRVYEIGSAYLNVEYERMRLMASDDAPENEASVQAWVGLDIDGNLIVDLHYANVGSNVWNAASVGFRAPGGRTCQTFSHLGSRTLSQGVVTFDAWTGLGTDPALVDTDGDGLSDSAEVLTHGSSPLLADTDGDGLSDAQEVTHGTGLNNPDSDGDGLLDGWEVASQLNPLSSSGDDGASGDIDNDGLTNIQEQEHGGNPRSADTDGDGLADPEELLKRTSLSLADTDHDGLPDGLEVSLDLDPLQPDSDGDGMNDGWEYQHRDAGFDPAVDNATDLNPGNDADADPDGDGLTNAQECEWGTNPSGLDENHDGVPDGYDTDGDGVNDGAEIAQNSDPADAGDEGRPNSRAPVSFYFGDPSGSHSEKYRLEVTPVSGVGDTPRSFSWLNENYGECETKKAMLMPGWKYEVRLHHAGTDPKYNGSPKPDYDYELDCGTASLPPNVVVEDPSSLFGTDYTSTKFVGEGKVARIHVLSPPQIDAPEVVGVNNDDDNGNKKVDWMEKGEVSGDDDLAEVTVSAYCPDGKTGTVTVRMLTDVNAVRVWKDVARTEQVGSSDSFAVVGQDGASRTYYIEGDRYSARYLYERIQATFECGGATSTNEYRFTVVERIAEPIITERSGGQVVNPCCAVVGAGTPMRVKVLPRSFPDEKIEWRVVSGAGSFGGDGTGRDVVFTASGSEGSAATLQVDVGDCPGRAPQFTLHATTMHEVLIYPCAVVNEEDDAIITESQIATMLNEVNAIYKQVGMHFSLGASLMSVTNDIWARYGLTDSSIGNQVRNIMSGTGGIEVYFISGNGMPNEPRGSYTACGIIVKDSANANTLAHEIGHACGWYDIYRGVGNNIDAALENPVRQSWLPGDWNNGTGSRFYDPWLLQSELIPRLIMYKYGSDSKCDIPANNVYGLPESGGFGLIGVGRSPFMTLAPSSL